MMRRAGVARHVTQGMLLLECDASEPPSIGTVVVDEELTRVGEIVDVIGPTDAPFLVVAPVEAETAAAALGNRLYRRGA